ncbi:uncharacterized protein LOC144702065 [Wolffia australiana]
MTEDAWGHPPPHWGRHDRQDIFDGYRDRGRPRPRVAEPPVFSEVDPDRWLCHLEQYFRSIPTDDAERLHIASSYMDGKAAAWFCYLDDRVGFQDWGDFKRQLSRRFVDELVASFMELVGYLPSLGDDSAMLALHSALRPTIRAEVRQLRPCTTAELIECALEAEATLAELTETEDRGGVHLYRAPEAAPPRPPAAPPGVQNGGREGPVRARRMNLTQEELLRKCGQGLCFQCNEQFTPGHRCRRDLRIHIVTDHPEAAGVPLEEANESDSEEEGPLGDEQLNVVRVESRPARGSTSPHALQIQGAIRGHALGLPLNSAPPYQIRYGNSTVTTGNVQAAAVSVNLQGYTAVVTLLPVPNLSTDVILGYPWLRTLGWTQARWDLFLLKFRVDGVWHTLEGDPTKASSLEARHPQPRVTGALNARYISPTSSPRQAPASTDARTLFEHRFPRVFHHKGDLPPRRALDHRITLLPGTGPVNSRPYRYSHCQKNELERLVREQLKAGLIRPSHSPYSSPALLVRKKDNQWRFCVDYCALNKITVPNRFPIPVVDELLAELHGMSHFSKLDLKSGYH